MKLSIFNSIAILLISSSSIAQSVKQVSSEIDKATIYMRGAEISRTGNTNISSGIHEIVLHSLENGIDANSIQINGSGVFSIMSVELQQRFVDDQEVERSPYYKRLKRAEDSLREQNWIHELAKEKLNVLEAERKLLYNNPIATGKSIGDSLDLLIDGIDFLREQLYITNGHIIEAKKDLYEEELITNGINARVNKLRQLDASWTRKNPTLRMANEIHVTIESERSQNIVIQATYQLTNAGWNPVYDFKASNLNSGVNLVYKAEVWQQTGIDWESVNLTLATTRPSANQQKPTLPKWEIGEIKPYMNLRGSRANTQIMENEVMYEMESSPTPQAEDNTYAVEPNRSYDYVQNLDGLTYRSYRIDKKYSINSGNQRITIEIDNSKLDAEFVYKAVPKMACDAYLIAMIPDWESLNLVPAKANLYLEERYVGAYNLQPSTLKDTMDLSFGMDSRIQVERTLDKTKEKDPTFGNYQTVYKNYIYSVTNKANAAIDLIIEDRYPITKIEDVEIELIEGKVKSKWNQKTGEVSWSLKVTPKERKEFESGFSVRYPKNKPVFGF